MAEKLAIYGGPKAKTTPNYPMYPGGLEIGEAEKKEVMEVLDNKYLFRYYGPEGVESKVRKFEEHFKAKNAASYPGVTQTSPTEIAFECGDWLDALRMLDFTL